MNGRDHFSYRNLQFVSVLVVEDRVRHGDNHGRCREEHQQKERPGQLHTPCLLVDKAFDFVGFRTAVINDCFGASRRGGGQRRARRCQRCIIVMVVVVVAPAIVAMHWWRRPAPAVFCDGGGSHDSVLKKVPQMG